jgi:DNA-directed RNA polymerase specialized sigma24 family protein
MSAIGSSSERVEGVRVASRTATSFEVFFETERIRLYRVLFAITGSRQEAEDISQEASLRVWERWDRVAELDEPVGYLRRTAMNVFRDRRRRLLLGLKRVLRPPAVLSATSCLWIDRYGSDRACHRSSRSRNPSRRSFA